MWPRANLWSKQQQIFLLSWHVHCRQNDSAKCMQKGTVQLLKCTWRQQVTVHALPTAVVHFGLPSLFKPMQLKPYLERLFFYHWNKELFSNRRIKKNHVSSRKVPPAIKFFRGGLEGLWKAYLFRFQSSFLTNLKYNENVTKPREKQISVQKNND